MKMKTVTGDSEAGGRRVDFENVRLGSGSRACPLRARGLARGVTRAHLRHGTAARHREQTVNRQRSPCDHRLKIYRTAKWSRCGAVWWQVNTRTSRVKTARARI